MTIHCNHDALYLQRIYFICGDEIIDNHPNEGVSDLTLNISCNFKLLEGNGIKIIESFLNTA